MASVNLFIGGTGVNLAVLVKDYADFYRLTEYPRIFAIDTDASAKGVAERSLGKALVLASPGFIDRVRNQLASRWLQEGWTELWDDSGARTLSFGDPILKAGAEVIRDYFKAAGGLWTLRGAGWIAFQDISNENRMFVNTIVSALGELFQSSHGQRTPVLNVIASVAGGTGSGLFIPLISDIRQRYDPDHDGKPPLEVHLHVVLPSAFTNNWNGAAAEEVLRTRGQAGAFAAYREIFQISEEADVHVKPEDRSVLGVPYGPGLINKVFWWGRRGMDARSRADDTFYEAGKLVTLLNDGPIADRIHGAEPEGNNRRVSGIATIEYPKLERAQAITAQAVRHMVEQIREGKPASPPAKILKQSETDKSCPPILGFVHDQRSANQALGSMFPAGAGQFEYAKVEGLLATLRRIISGAPSDEQLTNQATAFTGGRLLGSLSNYRATTDAEWKDYLDRVLGRLQTLEDLTLGEMRAYCAWLPIAADSWISDAARRMIGQSQDPATGLPSLETIRRGLSDLVTDLDRARLVFAKPPEKSILGGPRGEALLSGDQQQQLVNQRKLEMAKMLESNPDFRREPPREWYHHPALQGLALVVALGFLISALLTTALASMPVIGGLLGAGGAVLTLLGTIAGRVTAGIPFLRGNGLELPPLYGAIAAVVVFAILRIMRERAFREKPQLREEKERELVQASAELVELRMLEMLWQATVLACERIVGQPSDSEAAAGDRLPSSGSSLHAIFTVLRSGALWLEDLRNYAEEKKQAATRTRPGWVIPIGEYRDPEGVQLSAILPKPMVLDARNPVVANVKQISDIALTFNPKTAAGDPGPAISLRFSGWKPRNERTLQENEEFDQTIGRFYTDLERVILPAVADAGLIKKTLNDAMTFDDRALADELDNLAKRAHERGPAAELTVKRPMSAHLVVPDEAIRQRVRAALATARANPQLAYAHDLPTDIELSQNVGQSIALVLVGYFGADAKLAEIDGIARTTYYGIGHRTGQPNDTGQYSAKTTEFHLIPELSRAARAESSEGLDSPVSPLLTQRLFGSHQALDASPSMLEIYYLCRARGYLKWEGTSTDQTCYLEVGVDRVPLLSANTIGASAAANDPLGKARDAIVAFDALRTCFTAVSRNFGQAPLATLPPGARIRADAWKLEATGAAIARAKRALYREWTEFSGPRAEVERTTTYAAMSALALEDANGMVGRVGQEWRLLTNAVFAGGQKNLVGRSTVWDRAGITPSTS
jgi:hypothetical protein